MMGVSSPYRRPSVLARSGSACTAGSARSFSIVACSAARSASRSNTAYLLRLCACRRPDRRAFPPPARREGNGSRGLAAARSLLAKPALEPRDSPAGVENLLLAGVEGVTARADVGVDDAVLGRAPRRERVTAAADHRGVYVLRVNSGLHVVTPGSRGRRVASRRAGVNRYRIQ